MLPRCGGRRGLALLVLVAIDGAISASRDPDDLEQELLEFGAYLGDPKSPPGGGSDLDLSLLKRGRDSKCETVILTDILGSRPDPQLKIRGAPKFDYMERWYRSVLTVPGGRMKSVVLHDILDENITNTYTTRDGAVSFRKVDISGMDPIMGLNDLRFLLFEEELNKHPEWDTVFLTDIRDVVVVHNPCSLVEERPDALFVQSEKSSMKPFPYVRGKFEEMGGKYLEWYDAVPDQTNLLSPGLIGGKRSVVLKALDGLNAVMTDPELASRKEGKVKINFVAANYAFRTNFDSKNIVTGSPLHSEYWAYENRTDVYFRHK